MNTPLNPKIQPHHQQRKAVVYVRQSTTKQVLFNQESTRRQYQLAEKARELGWPQPLISVIDDDLGLSGTSSTQRQGFQRLVASLGLAEIGLILVTEISRLSRLNSDWQRVLELCAVFKTLIADEDGLYDPRDPNDRLVLGLKGTLFAAELQILHARMQGALLNKARRGELALRLPVGYCRQHDGSVVTDPDERVRWTLQIIFEQFVQIKSARGVQRYMLEHDLNMPRRIQQGQDYGQLVWVKPTYIMVQQILTNPVYAGVFVYGRRKQLPVPGDPSRSQLHRLAEEEWEIMLPGTYPSYISFDQYHRNRQILRDNLYNFDKKGRGAVREGGDLLQGLLVCGRCGRRMNPTYGSKYPTYCCRREQLTYGASQCQGFSARYLDQAVSELFLEAVQPAHLELVLSSLAELERERQQLDRHWQLRLEGARYAVRLAQRQYDAVDPDNRLVAGELERRWNAALQDLNQLEQEYGLLKRNELKPLSEAEQLAVRQLSQDLPAVWFAPTTKAVDRKRLLRLVIEDVTVTTYPEQRSAKLVVRWNGGHLTEYEVHCPPIGWHCITAEQILARIRELASQLPDHQIAQQLNAEGIATQTGKEWTYQRVFSMRKKHKIPTNCPVKPQILNEVSESRGDGLLGTRQASQLLGVSDALINLWVHQGVLVSEQRLTQSCIWVRLNEQDIARLSGAAICEHLPTIAQVMEQQHLSREEVWQLVKAGEFVAYRCAVGQKWEWRLEKACEKLESGVG